MDLYYYLCLLVLLLLRACEGAVYKEAVSAKC